MGQSKLYYVVTNELYYRDVYELSSDGTLGPLMNIWPDENLRHDDQLFLGVF
jgi:hypothetical protein